MTTTSKKKLISQNANVFVFVKNKVGGVDKLINSLKKINNENYKLSFVVFEENPKNPRKNNYFNNQDFSLYPTPKKVFLFIKRFVHVSNLLKNKRPMVTVVIGLYPFLLIHLVKRFTNSKYPIIFIAETNIIKLVESKPFLFYRKILKFLLKIFIEKTDFIVFVSKSFFSFFSDKLHLKNLSTKSLIIPHGISLSQTKKLSTKKIKEINLFKPNLFILTSVGVFNEPKDFSVIIKAFKIVHDKEPKSRLILVGDGPLKNELKQQVINLKLTKFVYFLGWKKNVFPYLKASDIFIYSSKYEGFGYVILEALSQKLPVIATSTPYGPSEILENGKYGVLIPVQNHKKMAAAIIKLINNDSLKKKYSKLAYQRVKYFSEEKMLKQYENLFLSLVSNKK